MQRQCGSREETRRTRASVHSVLDFRLCFLFSKPSLDKEIDVQSNIRLPPVQPPVTVFLLVSRSFSPSFSLSLSALSLSLCIYRSPLSNRSFSSTPDQSITLLSPQLTIGMYLFHHRPLKFAWFCTSRLVFHITLNTLFVSAYTPTIVHSTQYATMNSTVYVQGGYAAMAISNIPLEDFFSLSLSEPWNDTAPPWNSLPSNVSAHPLSYLAGGGMAATPDNNNLVLWNPTLEQIVWLYNPKNNSWTSGMYPLSSTLGPSQGGMVVIDPESIDKGYGDLYAPSGCRIVNASYNTMCDYNMRNYGIRDIPMPPSPIPNNTLGFSFAYCTLRKSMMLYGGQGELFASNPYLFEYSAKDSVWSFLVRALVLSTPAVMSKEDMVRMRRRQSSFGWLLEVLKLTLLFVFVIGTQTPLGNSPGDLSGHCMVQCISGAMLADMCDRHYLDRPLILSHSCHSNGWLKDDRVWWRQQLQSVFFAFVLPQSWQLHLD